MVLVIDELHVNSFLFLSYRGTIGRHGLSVLPTRPPLLGDCSVQQMPVAVYQLLRSSPSLECLDIEIWYTCCVYAGCGPHRTPRAATEREPLEAPELLELCTRVTGEATRGFLSYSELREPLEASPSYSEQLLHGSLTGFSMDVLFAWLYSLSSHPACRRETCHCQSRTRPGSQCLFSASHKLVDTTCQLFWGSQRGGDEGASTQLSTSTFWEPRLTPPHPGCRSVDTNTSSALVCLR
ncbi:hypothetical protein DPEC_G00370610 [Dallia pectoralis]|nr:hypothetical protein DPEC_G00370610 [Dallia pectoralis]